MRVLLLLVAAAGLIAVPVTARAEDEETKKESKVKKDAAAEEDDESGDEEERAAKHFASGRKLYAEGKYKEAIESLLKAYHLRPAPPILLNIARTYEKLNDKKNALKFYKEFLQKARMVDPNRKPVEAVVRELEKQVTGRTGAVTSAAGTHTPSAAVTTDDGRAPGAKQQLIHTPVDAAKVNQSVTVMAELPPQVSVDGVVLHFRRGGERDFEQVKMEVQGEAYVGRIPASYVTTTSLQYYIEAYKAQAGRRLAVALAGAKNTPHIIVVEGGMAIPIGPVKEEKIRSPHFTWAIVGSATAVAFAGLGIGMAMLARDRANAMETVAARPIKQAFDLQGRDWESQGKTFNIVGWTFIGLGIATAGAAGYFWYADRKWIKAERRRRTFGRTVAAPYIDSRGAGLMGRVDF